MTAKQKVILFVLIDLLSAALVWLLFYIYRLKTIENSEIIFKGSFFKSMVVLPIFWIFLYAVQGTYHNVQRNYRIKTLKQTLYGTLIGGIIIFFVFLLNDYVTNYTQFYNLFLVFIGLHFLITIIPRFIFTTIHVKSIHSGKVGYNTIIIGGSSRAVQILDEIRNLKQNPGFKFKGFININGSDLKLNDQLPYLGHVDDINDILKKSEIEEAIIALESTDHERLKNIITNLSGHDIKISLIPDGFDILSGQVQMNSIFGALLINITPSSMPDWQFSTKRILDFLISRVAILALMPIYLIIAFAIKLTSKGPVFFFQNRIGKYGKPFKIIKFRTMFNEAEKNGPQLSSTNDKRITKVGKFLRKSRLDEFPPIFKCSKR